MMYNKYSAMKCRCSKGHLHDSKKEARRCNELTLLERVGEINNLRQQVKYTLIPTQYEQLKELYTKGKNKGQPKRGKLLEKECAYYADFDYYTKSGMHIVEDTKGVKTKEYIIKRKLMLFLNKIQIREI